MNARFHILILSITLFTQANIYCESLPENVARRICDSIFVVEGGAKTKYPYGIKSVPIKGNTIQEREAYARRICENTVRNHYARWQSWGKTNSFLDSLADRYCPRAADGRGNLNWKKNIRKISGLDF